jgi:hypothetical protein
MKHRVARLGVVVGLIAAAAVVSAQRGGGRGGGGPQPAQSPQQSAPIDLTGYWVSIVNEDWRWRMVTPPKGDVASVPINAEGRKIAQSWDPKLDGSCLAYGAAGLMRMPTRLNITWENDRTLKIDTDAGVQTRRLLFERPASPPPPSLQGLSIAEWERPGAGGRGGGGFGGGGAGAPPDPPPVPAGAPAGDGRGGAGRGGAGAPPGPPPAPAGAPAGDGRGGAGRGGAGRGGRGGAGGGALKVTTTNLSGGWLRRNGVPYSDGATMTEYFDRFAVPGGDEWLVVTTVVSDPKYLTQEFVTSSHFKKEADGAKKWDPTPCKP